MNTVSILIKTESKLKAEAQKTAAAMGLSLSSVINRYLKHFISAKTITFHAEDEEEPSAYLKSVMKQAEKNLKTGNHSPVFKTGEEMIAWLEKQGV